MFDPVSYPYTRVQNYTDGAPPKVLSDEFYNPTQDHLATLFGAFIGQSHSIRTEEFERESGGILTAGPFGTELSIATASNARTFSIAAGLAGEHGVWRAQVIADAGFDFIARDNSCFVGSRQFIWVAKVKLGARARLDTVANEGFILGLNDTSTGLPSFVAGKDKPNWQAFVGMTFFDTGIPVVDDEWVWLFITRRTDGNVRWYIQTGLGGPVPVVTQPFPGSLTSCRRFLRFHDGTGIAKANDFFEIDMYGRGIER